MKELVNSNVSVAFFIGAISMAAFLQLIYYRSESVRINKYRMEKVTLLKVLDLLEIDYVEIILDRKVIAKGIVKSGEKIPEQFERYLPQFVKCIRISNSEQLCTCFKIELEKSFVREKHSKREKKTT